MEVSPQGTTTLWAFVTFAVTLVCKDMERRKFPTAESLNAAMTEEANLLTHTVSLLLFRLHLAPQGTCSQPCPEHSSVELVPARQLSSWPVETQRLSLQLQQISQRLGWERTL